jgi:hypothetical protein
MRCKPFTAKESAALRTLGFALSDDRESAEIDVSAFPSVSIIHPHGSRQLELSVSLPNGSTLSAQLSPDQLIDVAAYASDAED